MNKRLAAFAGTVRRIVRFIPDRIGCMRGRHQWRQATVTAEFMGQRISTVAPVCQVCKLIALNDESNAQADPQKRSEV